MYNQIVKLPKLSRITMDYVLYPKTKRKMDLGNILSIHQKFLEDALVELGKIHDDDYKHIIASRFRFGHVDPENPHVEVLIKEL